MHHYIILYIANLGLNVSLFALTSIVALFWKLKELGEDFKSRHDYTFGVSPDSEFKAQSH